MLAELPGWPDHDPCQLQRQPRLPPGTAPIFSIAPEEGETARFSFIVPILGIPITIPVTVRTTTDYGLRFTVSDITEVSPLAEAKLTLWGFPAEKIHDPERFPIGSPGNPTGCPEEEGTGCIANPISDSIVPQPLIDNPTTCTGQEPISVLEVQTYGDPTHPSEGRATYPPIEGCQREVFKPVLRANPTTTETDSASGLNVDLSSPQFLTFAAEPSEIKAATVTLPEGFTINPDAADGQTACSDAQANFSSEGPAECPDQSKIGTFSIGTPALPERLEGSAYIGEPKPGNQYRLFLTASGFGMNIKFVGSFKPDPKTGRLTAEFSNSAPGAVRRLPAAPVLRRTGADGDPDHLHHLHDAAGVLPLERDLGRTGIDPGLRARIRPATGANARDRFVPSSRPWKRAPPTRLPAPSLPSA